MLEHFDRIVVELIRKKRIKLENLNEIIQIDYWIVGQARRDHIKVGH